MADVTVDRDARRQSGELRAAKMAAVKLLKGTLANFNTSGYAKIGADAASELFAGVTYEQVDNTGGSAGDKSIRLWKQGDFDFNFSGTSSQADLGKTVYVVDNNTVALAATTTNDIACGTISEFISATRVRININGFAKG